MQDGGICLFILSNTKCHVHWRSFEVMEVSNDGCLLITHN